MVPGSRLAKVKEGAVELTFSRESEPSRMMHRVYRTAWSTGAHVTRMVSLLGDVEFSSGATTTGDEAGERGERGGLVNDG